MFKRVFFTLATSVMATIAADSKNIAFNAPVKWATYRNNSVQVQFVTDSTLYDKQIVLTMKSVQGTKKSTLATQRVTVSNLGNKVEFPKLKKGKTLHYSLEWSVQGEEGSGSVEPFAIATLPQDIINDEITLKSLNGKVVTPESLLKESALSFENVGGLEVSLLGNESVCAIVVKKGQGEATIAFDPANSKDGFLTFSHRFITVSDDSVSFTYKKKEYADAGLTYETQQWYGELTSASNDEKVAIVFPWSELGVKYQSGRRLGFALSSSKGTYPEMADLELPATWKNIKIK